MPPTLPCVVSLAVVLMVLRLWRVHYRLKLSSYKGKWVVFFFYPKDFTFVCPTEIIAFSDRVEEFRKLGCEVCVPAAALVGIGLCERKKIVAVTVLPTRHARTVTMTTNLNRSLLPARTRRKFTWRGFGRPRLKYSLFSAFSEFLWSVSPPPLPPPPFPSPPFLSI